MTRDGRRRDHDDLLARDLGMLYPAGSCDLKRPEE